jgi:hypothetical protein
MKNTNNIDELYREKLQNFEKDPPAYLLENILAAAGVQNRTRKLLFWRIAGVAAALLLAFVAGWQFNSRDRVDLKPQTVMTKNPALKPETQAIIQSETKIVSNPAEPSYSLVATLPHVNQVKSSKSIKSVSVSEITPGSSMDESLLLKPLNSRFSKIPCETASVKQLQERKTNEASSEWTEKSIDQQIMEQNQKLAVVQNADKGKGRWMVGAQVSPAYNISNSSHSAQYASNMLAAESTHSVDLGAGLTVAYKPGKRWSVQSGVYYSGMAQNSGVSGSQNSKNSFAPGLAADYVNTSVNVDASSNKLSMNSTAGVIELKGIPAQIILGSKLESNSVTPAVFASDVQFTQNFEYIEIPLCLRYTLIDSRFGVEMMGGFSSNLLVGNETYMQGTSGKSLVGSTKDMEPINYSGTMGVGLKYSLSKRIFLNVEPRVKYYLNSLNSNSSVSYKPYTIGVFTGLSYQF